MQPHKVVVYLLPFMEKAHLSTYLWKSSIPLDLAEIMTAKVIRET